MKCYASKIAIQVGIIIFAGIVLAAESRPLTAPVFRMPGGNTLLENVTLVIFDTETTGFSPVHDRLVEVGGVRIRGGQILEEKTWLINPQRSIPFYARRVHTITRDMVRHEPTFAEIYPEFLEFIRGAVLIAHNAPFDVRFITAEAERHNLPIPHNPVLCSLSLFRNWFPDLKSHALTELIAEFGIDIGDLQAHRAVDDSLFVHFVLQQELVSRNGTPRFSDLLNDAGRVYQFEDYATSAP